jgi:hypothetical protein
MKKLVLHPMSEAPKDGTEIFAVPRRSDCYGNPIKGTMEESNFHPLIWKDYKWKEGYRPHWGMRWSDDFRPYEAQYEGWIDPKDIKFAVASQERREG